MIFLVPIFFDAAESNAGMKHLDEMSFGANDDSRVTPVRERLASIPAAAHPHEEADSLAKPSGAAHENNVARARIR